MNFPPLPEPVELARVERPGQLRITLAYSTAQMEAYGRRCAAAALEEAAKLCDARGAYVDPLAQQQILAQQNRYAMAGFQTTREQAYSARGCATAIRAIAAAAIGEKHE